MKMGYKGRIITSDENIRAKRFASEFICNWSSAPKPFSLLEGINLLKKTDGFKAMSTTGLLGYAMILLG